MMWCSAQKEEQIGRRFGRLTVVGLADKAPDGRTQYHCICDCGHMRIVTGKNLKSGNTTSCGCKRIERCKAGVKNLAGQRFGRLLVLKRAGTSKLRTATWLCKCDCGKTCEVSGSYLRQGDTRSCGCYQRESISARSFKDITGCRFGKLTVIKRLKNYNDGKRGVHWLCLCDCENEIVALADNLLEGNQRSCGCLKTSSGEYEICQFLNDNGISFCREKTFSGCKDKK